MEIFNLIIQMIAAVGSVLAAFASCQALKIANQANQLAERTATESANHIRESNQLARATVEQAEAHARATEEREKIRDQRRIASNLQAWWVTNNDNKQSNWGVVLSNTGSDSSVFHDICVKFTCNSTTSKHKVTTLPPGTYFLESTFKSNGSPELGFPQLVDNLRDFQPLLNSKKHAIEELSFQDQVGQKWTWTSKSGLSPRESIAEKSLEG
ncbi:hypothetical protein [Corynebacterium rouxii]|uniref:hypothetical protein n=1 Tax=Corynebacterium rouxii TaxID=2719119 RepID=UPI00313F3BBE